MNPLTLCRVCLKDCKEDEFPNNSLLRPALCQLFYSLTTLDVRQDAEGFPKQLCSKCLFKLRSYEQFREEVLRNSKTLDDMINREVIKKRMDNVPLEETVINCENVKKEDLSVVNVESAYTLGQENENDENDKVRVNIEKIYFSDYSSCC